MHTTWISHGQSHGYHMVITWTPHWYQMDTTWIPHGYHMNSTWITHGHHMRVMDSYGMTMWYNMDTNGKSMFITWIPWLSHAGHNMKTICKLHGVKWSYCTVYNIDYRNNYNKYILYIEPLPSFAGYNLCCYSYCYCTILQVLYFKWFRLKLCVESIEGHIIITIYLRV